MSTPFLGEIRLASFTFAPKGWALCNGALLPINQNQALFSLLGTTYGGDGRVNFALPNLQGRVPIHFSSTHPLGEVAGETAHTLGAQEMPSHTHPVGAVSAAASVASPLGALPAQASTANFAPPAAGPPAAFDPAAVSSAGSGLPHENTQPFLVISFVIALQGIFPSRN